MREPIENLIEQATQQVEADGYKNADPNSVNLAAFGYLARTLAQSQQATRDEMVTQMDRIEKKLDGKRSSRQLALDGGRIGVLAAAIAGLAEVVRTVFVG